MLDNNLSKSIKNNTRKNNSLSNRELNPFMGKVNVKKLQDQFKKVNVA